MYSLIRVWIGLKLARMLIQRQGRRQHDERDRQPVRAELVLDAEDRDPVERHAELEAGAVRQEGDEQDQRDDPGRPARSRARSPARTAPAGSPRRSAPSSGRKVTIDRIGTSADVDHRGDQQQVRAGHHDQPDRDAEGVVLDPAGLDAAEPAAGRDRGAADRVDRPVDDLAVEPPQARRDLAADDDEQQVVEVVEPPLVERRAIQERRPGPLSSRTRSGRAGDRSGRRCRRRRAARRSRCRRRPTVTLARISTPSMPNSAKARLLVAERIDSPPRRPARASGEIRLSPSGSPRNMPRKTDGMASRISGIVMTGGDSWILSQISFGPRNSPQKVRPMSRNM